MAGYRLIDTSIWDGDDWFDGLAPDEKLLFIYFFSNRQGSLSGLYPLLKKYIPLHTGIEPGRVNEIMAAFAAAGKVYYEDGLVWVVNMTKWQCRGEKIPSTVITKILKDVAAIPSCPLKDRFVAYCREKNTLPIPYTYPIDTRDPNPNPNPNPKSESLSSKGGARAKPDPSPTPNDPSAIHCDLKNGQYPHVQRLAEWLNDEYGKLLYPLTAGAGSFRRMEEQLARLDAAVKVVTPEHDFMDVLKAKTIRGRYQAVLADSGSGPYAHVPISDAVSFAVEDYEGKAAKVTRPQSTPAPTPGVKGGKYVGIDESFQ